MIITVHQQTQPKQYSFKEDKIQVTLGRKPSSENSIVIDQHAVSKKHLIIKHKYGKLFVKDLGSKNGTFLHEKQIQPEKYVEINPAEKVTLALADCWVQVELREQEIKKKKNRFSSSQSEESQESQQQRSREKMKASQREKKQIQSTLKISQSSLKMLRQMSRQGKKKEQKIKFMKLMGHKNIENEWSAVEQYLQESTLKEKMAAKKMEVELEKQFMSGRSNAEKKGLGKR